MSQLKRQLSIEDKRGFHYSVTVKHDPQIGVSIAYFDDMRVASLEYGRCCKPPVNSDDDREWEQYQEKLNELADWVESDLKPMCIDHFNKSNQVK